MDSILEKLWSEPALMQHLSLTKLQIVALREEGLPFIRANTRTRLYRDDAVYEFLVQREVVHRIQHKVKAEE